MTPSKRLWPLCLVISCNSKGPKDVTTNQRIKYVVGPNKDPERSAWFKLCGRKETSNKNQVYICEKHFPVEVLHNTICLSLNKKFCKCKFPVNTPRPSLNLSVPKKESNKKSTRRSSVCKESVSSDNDEEREDISCQEIAVSKSKKKVKVTENITKDTVEKVHQTRKRKTINEVTEKKSQAKKAKLYKKAKNLDKIKNVCVKSIVDKNTAETTKEKTLKRAPAKRNPASLLKVRRKKPTVKITKYEILTGQATGEDLEVFSEDEEVELFNVDTDQEPVACLQDLCRICAQQKPGSVRIFGKEGNTQNLFTKIDQCLTIKVQEDDILSLMLCKDCITKLDASYDLSMMAQKSEQLMLSFILQEEYLFKPEAGVNNLLSQDLYHNEQLYNPDSYDEFDNEPVIENASPSPSEIPSTNMDHSYTVSENVNCIPITTDFTCKACDLTVKPNEAAAKHCLITHQTHMCTICQTIFQTQYDLDIHYENISVIHLNKKSKFKCLICKTGFDTVKATTEHCLNIHTLHMCEICLDFFTCQQLLDMHMEKGHVFTKSLKNMHSNSSNLLKNNNKINNKPKHVCNVCWKIFFSTELFNKHLKNSCKDTISIISKLQKSKKIDLSIRKFENQKTKVSKRILCGICNKYIHSLGHRSTLQEHYKSKHHSLLCRICLSYFTNDMNKLKLHAASKHNKINNLNRYNCNYCNKYYYFKSNLKLHIAKKHLRIPVKFKCKNCQLNFTSRQAIKNHMFEQHTIKIKKLKPKKNVLLPPKKGVLLETKDCNLCIEKLPSIYLKRHYKRVHDHFLCIYCSNVYYNTYKSLQKHLKNEHNKIKTKYICDHCKLVINTKKELKLHILNTHNIISSIKNFTCTLCNLKYYLKCELISHLKIQHDYKYTYNCKICSQIFIKQDELNDHIKLQHNYICKICCIDVKSVHILGVHCRLYHYNNWSYICNICKSSFNSESSVILHCDFHIHKDKIKYKNNLYYKKTDYYCEKCDNYFMTPTVLKLHMSNKHPAITTTQTFIINESPKDRNILLNVSNFKCEYCKEQFALKESYDCHILTHHHTVFESFVCNYCDIVCDNEELLSNHIYNIHNIIQITEEVI